ANLQFIEQYSVKLGIDGLFRPAYILATSGGTLNAEQKDFAGITLDAWLNAYTHSGFVLPQPQVAHQGWRKLVTRLPSRGELASLRTLFSNLESIVDEVLARRSPDLRRRTERNQPASLFRGLQAEFTGLVNYHQPLRPRHFIFAGRTHIGDMLGNRQQRLDQTQLAASRGLHGSDLMRLQIVAATVAKVSIFAPQPATAASSRDDQGKGRESGQSLHACSLHY